MVAKRKMFATMILPSVDHLPRAHSLPDMSFSKDQPTWRAHLASNLERLVALNDASSIEVVIF